MKILIKASICRVRRTLDIVFYGRACVKENMKLERYIPRIYSITACRSFSGPSCKKSKGDEVHYEIGQLKFRDL